MRVVVQGKSKASQLSGLSHAHSSGCVLCSYWRYPPSGATIADFYERTGQVPVDHITVKFGQPKEPKIQRETLEESGFSNIPIHDKSNWNRRTPNKNVHTLYVFDRLNRAIRME